MTKAYLNALSESSKKEIFEWLCKLDAENDRLRDALRKAVATFDDFANTEAKLGRHTMANAAGIARDATQEALDECDQQPSATERSS